MVRATTRKCIDVHTTTRERLKAIARYGDSYDSVLKRLLDRHEVQAARESAKSISVKKATA